MGCICCPKTAFWQRVEGWEMTQEQWDIYAERHARRTTWPGVNTRARCLRVGLMALAAKQDHWQGRFVREHSRHRLRLRSRR
jgi:hypothetical protein